jgi:hypothetical protein
VVVWPPVMCCLRRRELCVSVCDCVCGVFFVLGHLFPFFFCLIQRYAVLLRVREKMHLMPYGTKKALLLLPCFTDLLTSRYTFTDTVTKTVFLL